MRHARSQKKSLRSRQCLRNLPTRHPDLESGILLQQVDEQQQHVLPELIMAATKMTKNQMRRAKKKEQKKAKQEVRASLNSYSIQRIAC